MAQDKLNLALDGLRGEIHEPLTLFAERLTEALGDNLQSITVVGSSLTDDFSPGKSDINTVLVLGQHRLSVLDAIAAMAKPMSRKKVAAPLLMTPAYIARSLDVFSIEFLDFQLTHKTIYGDDPFQDLTIAAENVRLQCERELKATLIRLRQAYIAAAANKKLIRDVLTSAAKALLPLLRAMLWLKGRDRPNRTAPTLAEATSLFGIKTDPILTAIGWRHHKPALQQAVIQTTFESLYAVAEQLAQIVDELEV